MFKSTEPTLPFDTIVNIIDSLIQDNSKAKGLQYVKTCSLVCQSFLPLCRTHIFSSIKIKVAGSSQKHNTEAFGQLVLETPEIARYIRHLNIAIVSLPVRISLQSSSTRADEAAIAYRYAFVFLECGQRRPEKYIVVDAAFSFFFCVIFVVREGLAL